MKAHHYLAVGIRLFAIWLFLYSVKFLGHLIENIIYGTVIGIEASVLITGLSYAPWAIFSIFLWFFPITIAKKIVPYEIDLEPKALAVREVVAILVSLLALYLLYRAIMDGFYWATFWNMSINSTEIDFTTSILAEHRASMWATAVELFTAIIMLLNSKKISVLITKC